MAALQIIIRRGNSYTEDVERGKHLVTAASKGNEDIVLNLLNSGLSVNADEYNKSLFYASKNYVTPLQVATAEGHLGCLRILIEHGADLNARDRFDVTAVHMAAENGHYLCLKLLLDSGADCCIPTKYSKKGCYTAHPHPGGTTPLHLAAARNHIDCVRELIQFGADYNAVDEKGRTSLYIAAEVGLEECVLAHLRNAIGRDILSLPGFETGDTPLHFCVMHNLVQCVSELLEHGSDVNLRNCSGFSPLHYAVLMNFDADHSTPDILRLLVLKGYHCDINLPDYAGQTALHYVSFNDGVRFLRRPELAAFLITYGANPTICNQRCHSLIQSEMRLASNDLTILAAIAKSSLRLPPLSSLNISPPPPSPPLFNEPQLNGNPHPNGGHLELPHPHPNGGHVELRRSHPNHPETPPHLTFSNFHGALVGPEASQRFHLQSHQEDQRTLRLGYYQRHHHHHFHHNYNQLDEHDLENLELLPIGLNATGAVGAGPAPAASGGDVVLGPLVPLGPRAIRKAHRLKTKYEWYKSICSKPRSLQHCCRFAIRKAMGYKRLKHIKDLPIPTVLQQYLLLEYDEFK